jgi:hypothetical protein
MKLADMKLVHQDAEITPDSWGSDYSIIIDRDVVCDIINTDIYADIYDINDLGVDITKIVDIYECGNKFYAVEKYPVLQIGGGRRETRDPLYIECDSPISDVHNGVIGVIGTWIDFDD